MEDYYFEGSLAEQKALVFSLIKMSKKLINVLYKKCFAITLVKHKNPPQPTSLSSFINFSSSMAGGSLRDSAKITEILWKDAHSESKAYIQLLQKVAELYEHVLDKAQFFRNFIAEIFVTVPTFRFLSLDALFKGFFFVFVYKDFMVREVVHRVQDHLRQVSQRHILAQVEQDYKTFMECDLTCWVGIMLECGLFESYQSIVAPNESLATQRQEPATNPFTKSKINNPLIPKTAGSKLKGETANFIALQKRYVKGFLAAYYRFND